LRFPSICAPLPVERHAFRAVDDDEGSRLLGEGELVLARA
jgi:hypothetical protein